MADQSEEMEKILSRLHSLELRLSRLESVVNLSVDASYYDAGEHLTAADQILNGDTLNEEEKGLESQIGRFGLAWLGNIVLLFGITFLSQYMMNQGYRFLSAFFGYMASAAIFLLAHYLKKSNVHLSSVLRINAQVLLFYITIRLHFFAASPVIPG